MFSDKIDSITVNTPSASESLGEQHDIYHYAEGMKRHLCKKSQIFDFIDSNEVVIFLDIGCATGDLLREKYERDVHAGFSDRKRTYIGVDISSEMVEEAKRQSSGKDIIFTTSLEEAMILVAGLRESGGKSVMTLSSVLHEVIHYQPEDSHKAFWNNVWNQYIDYVAIRDFSVNEGLEHYTTLEESVSQVRSFFTEVNFPSDHPLAGKNVLDIWEYGYDAIPGSSDPLLANKFSGWGSIERCDSFTHFLMTFEYLRLNDSENYGRGIRELHENYMSLPFQSLCREIPTTFSPVFIERGITENRNRFLLNFFGANILSDITPTKGMMVFKRRTSPEKYLKQEDNKLAMVDPVTRVLMERCIKHLTSLIGMNEGGAKRYLQSNDPNKNPDLDNSLRL
ncbi:MAG: class I SAM-dependent methyltransferase [Legionellaceae bacterium]|nr:class I SAM-dependent methyltransferase [Legionellaceae bacterium]